MTNECRSPNDELVAEVLLSLLVSTPLRFEGEAGKDLVLFQSPETGGSPLLRHLDFDIP